MHHMSLTTLPHPSACDLVAAPPPVAPGTVWLDATYGGTVTITEIRPVVDAWRNAAGGMDDDAIVNYDHNEAPAGSSVWLRDWHRFMIPAPPAPILCGWCEAPATDSVGSEPACVSHAASVRRHPASADDTPPWGTGRPNLVLVPDIDVDLAVAASIGDTL